MALDTALTAIRAVGASIRNRIGSWLRQSLPAEWRSWQRLRSGGVRGKVSRIFYALAAFDIAVVIIALMITHHVVGSLTRSVDEATRWRSVHAALADLRTIAAQASAPASDVFASWDVAQEERNLQSVAAAFEPKRRAVAAAVAQNAAQDLQEKIDLPLARASRAMLGLVERTAVVLRAFQSGDRFSAAALGVDVDRHQMAVVEAIDQAGGILRMMEDEHAQDTLARTRIYRFLELIGFAAIGLMIVFITLYGRRVSRMIERQHARLVRFNTELEARVDERTADLVRSEAATARSRAELARSNDHFDIALNNMNRGLCLFDRAQRIVVANKSYLEMYGLDPDHHRPGTSLATVLERRVAKGCFPMMAPEAYYAERREIIERGEVAVTVHTLRDGRIIEIGHFPTRDGGFVTTHDDITGRRRMEQHIVHLAHHDALTGLPNRRKFREELAAALKRTERGDFFACLCMDLDHFKQVNDTLGHPIGDRLLHAVADRLGAIVRKSDLVARVGGDEFAIIQVMSAQPEGAMSLSARLVEKLSEPYVIDGQQIVIGVSIGIAIAPTDGSDADVLLKNADLALYRAKSEGKRTYRLFQLEMDEAAKCRRQMELDLRQAVALEEFELFYQPLIETCSGNISGFEALLRWHHDGRVISPMDFIPLAEEIGLMGELGAWVLKRACAEAMRWPGHCRVAVNISPAQFRTRQLDLDVINALQLSGLSPRRLELEITESVLLERTDSTMAVLHRLRNCGIRIAMDDFGTGYSSLSYLHSFPFDKIKIDRSFTQSAGTSTNARAIVQAMLGLGKNLGMSTTAEGVETAEQLRHLRAEGCSEMQGYLFSKPVPAAEVPALIEQLEHNACHAA